MAKSADRGHQSWRLQGAAKRTEVRSKRLERWSLLFLFLLLVGFFAYILWPELRGPRHLVAVSICATEPMAVPVLEYSREDIKALNAIPDVQFHDSLGLQDAGSFANLGDQLDQLALGEDDTLVLYLVAHGISDGGEAYIVCSDFLSNVKGGRYNVRNLLQDLGRCRASQKLLILDTGRIAVDTRLGVLGNEFPRIVERELKTLPPDPELWVLVANAPLQTTVVSHRAARSVFGLAVSEALQGAADAASNVDRFVDLRELYEYVLARSVTWSHTETRIPTTPLLMKSGEGLVQRSKVPGETHRLIWLPKQEVEAEQEVEPEPDPQPQAAVLPTGLPGIRTLAAWQPASPETPATATTETGATDASREATEGQEPDAGASSEPEATSSAAPAAEPAPDAAAGSDEPQSARDQLHSTVAAAWEIRDALQGRSMPGAWSPVDFAPHLWREINAQLLYFETRCRSGNPTVTDEESPDPAAATLNDEFSALHREATMLLDDLRFIRARMLDQQPTPGSARTSVGTRLADRWQRFEAENGGAKQSVDQPADPERTAAKHAIRKLRDMLFVAPYYVRTHADLALDAPRTSPFHADLMRWLENLAEAQRQLRQLEAQTLESFELNRIATFSDHCDATEELQQSLEQRMQRQRDEAVRKIALARDASRLTVWLGSPLLSAPQRRALLEALVKEPGIPAPPELLGPEMSVSIAARPEQWHRLWEHAQLEVALAELVPGGKSVSGQTGIWEKPLARLAECRRDMSLLIGRLANVNYGSPEFAQAENGLWKQGELLGGELRDFYVSLPDRLANGDAHAANSQQVLTFVDPRDARRVNQYPFTPFQIEVKKRAVLDVVVEREVKLEAGSPYECLVTIRSSSQDVKVSEVSLQANENWLSVTKLPAAAIQVAGDGWYEQDWRWRIEPLINQEDAGRESADADVRVQWTDGQQAQVASQSIAFTLPAPNRIDLEVIRLGESKYQPDHDTSIPLGLFPNRTTRFQWTLVNRSGKEKRVNVTLHALPPQPQLPLAPGRIDSRIRSAVVDQITRVVTAPVIAQTSQPLALPGDGRRVELDFRPPPPAADAPPPPADPASPASQTFDVSSGLLCVIRDSEAPAEVWYKWIEVLPLEPKHYLAEDVSYHFEARRLVAELRPRQVLDGGRSSLPPGNPVAVSLDAAVAAIPPDAEAQLSGNLDLSTSPLQLYAVLPPDGTPRTVNLTVDGYPRAFIYDVLCGRPSPGNAVIRGAERKLTSKEIRINTLSVPGFERVYHFPPYVNEPSPAERDPEDKTEHVRLEKNGIAVFPAPAAQLVVDFAVDAPADAFRRENDRIELRLGEDLIPTERFYADRQMSVTLTKFEARGVVSLQAAVRDYRVTLAPGDLRNKRTFLQSQLVLPDVGQADDLCRLILDGQDPEIRTIDLEPARQGTEAVVRVQATDLSGVKAVEFGIDRNDSLTLDGPEAKAIPLREVRHDNEIHAFEFQIATQELAVGKYRLLVRVYDLVGRMSETAAVELVVLPDRPPPPTKGIIEGFVKFGNRPVRPVFFKVTIEGKSVGQRRVKLDDRGHFLIKDLPIENYRITAEGSVSGRNAAGEVKEIVPWQPGEKPPLTVTVAHGS